MHIDGKSAAHNKKPKTELLQKFDNLYNRKVDIFSRNDTILIVL